MKFFISYLASLFFCAACFAQGSVNISDKGVVLLLVLKNGKFAGSGTGFIVSNDVIATNFHVAGIHDVVVLTPGKGANVKPFKTQKLWGSADYDLQLLKTNGLGVPPLNLSSAQIKKGADVAAIGYPGVAEDMIEFDGVESTISKGIIGRIVEASWKEGGPKFSVIQHSAPINKGNSGGPLLDLCGRVVGVNTLKAVSIGVIKSGVTITSQSEGIFYASDIEVLLNQLNKLGIPISVKSDSCDLTKDTSKDNTKLHSSWFIPVGIFGALLLGALAVFLSFKRKEIIYESYTQFKRRSQPNTKLNFNKSTKLILSGMSSNGNSIRITIDQRFPIGSEVIVGRDSKLSRIVIDDPTISRQHASIKIMEDVLMVRDLNSTNGTWINNQKIYSHYASITSGGILKLGNITFTLSKE